MAAYKNKFPTLLLNTSENFSGINKGNKSQASILLLPLLGAWFTLWGCLLFSLVNIKQAMSDCVKDDNHLFLVPLIRHRSRQKSSLYI